MTFLLSLLGGALGVSVLSGLLPDRALEGARNIAAGLLGGAAFWGLADLLVMLDNSLSALLLMIIVGAFGGCVISLGARSLINILRQSR